MFKRTCLLVALATAFATGGASAAFIDNRGAALANQDVEVAFKMAQLEDVLLSIVPSSVAVNYQSDALKRLPVSIAGKGKWEDMVRQAAAQAGLEVTVDAASVLVKGNPATVVLATGTGTSSVAIPVAAAAATPMAAPTTVYAVELTDGRLSSTVERWARQANMQLVWEPSDVDYPIQASGAYGSDLRVALGNLFGSMQGAETPLRACIHPNQPQSVIRVIRKSDKCSTTVSES